MVRVHLLPASYDHVKSAGTVFIPNVAPASLPVNNTFYLCEVESKSFTFTSRSCICRVNYATACFNTFCGMVGCQVTFRVTHQTF